MTTTIKDKPTGNKVTWSCTPGSWAGGLNKGHGEARPRLLPASSNPLRMQWDLGGIFFFFNQPYFAKVSREELRERKRLEQREQQAVFFGTRNLSLSK